MEHNCENCGKLVSKTKWESSQGKTHFCCKACYNEYRAKKKNDRKRKCSFCNNEFTVRMDRVNNDRVFCSITCFNSYRRKTKDGKTYTNCLYCNKEFQLPPYLKNKSKIGNFCSRKCMGKWQSENIIGESSPCYIDGSKYGEYTSEFNYKLKEEIRRRDNYECQICGKHQSLLYRKLDVHHIDRIKNHNNKENLVSLCHPCHVKTTAGFEFWQMYFEELIKEKHSCLYGQNQIAISAK